MHSWATRLLMPPKSQPGEHYDLYHDAVICHRATGHTALKFHDAVSGWQSLSYEQLHTRCTDRLAEWKLAGVEAGASVCLVGRVEIELVIDLLTALRAGMHVSYLSNNGPAFLHRRLEALGPDHVAADPVYGQALEGFAELLFKPRWPSAYPPASRDSGANSTSEPSGRLRLKRRCRE